MISLSESKTHTRTEGHTKDGLARVGDLHTRTRGRRVRESRPSGVRALSTRAPSSKAPGHAVPAQSGDGLPRAEGLTVRLQQPSGLGHKVEKEQDQAGARKDRQARAGHSTYSG